MEGFNYEIAMHLSYMYDRSQKDKRFICKILDAKNEILNGNAVFYEDIQMINRLLDDVIKLQQICHIYQRDFGKYVFTHTDMEYLIDDDIQNAEIEKVEAKLKKLKEFAKNK